jgi:hypothetical protein
MLGWMIVQPSGNVGKVTTHFVTHRRHNDMCFDEDSFDKYINIHSKDVEEKQATTITMA